jgi:hypothetical protein
MSEFIEPKPPHWNNNRRYFYKYMTSDTAKLVIAKRTLRFSRPALLNDPFDMGFDLPLPIDAERLKPRIIDAMWNAHFGPSPAPAANSLGLLIAFARGRIPHMSREEFTDEFSDVVDESLHGMRDLSKFNEELRGFMATTKVLCLTDSPNNILMWTHYAEAHTGVVIRFRSIPEKDSMFGIAKPVQYVEDMPPLMSDDEVVAMLSGSGSLIEAGLMDKLVYTKALHWRYEQEWRISAGNGWSRGEAFEDVHFGPDELDGIIFGTNTSAENRHLITQLGKAQNAHVSIHEVKRSSQNFALEVVDVD